MQENGQIQVVDTGRLTPPTASNNLYSSRKSVYDRLLCGMPEVTICVLAYNRLDKTRRCVESVLKYTQDISYELLLVDNGSNDGTLEYFQSLQCPNKRIVHITKNLGAQYATNIAMRSFSGRYFALVVNDAVVTKNWLSNLLKCFESDPKIGMVTPGASNVSNFQEISLPFSTYEEMQRKAAVFNQSDPRKWEQRVRLVAIIYLLKREVVDLIGLDDPGFFHDFEEDDLSVRVRRAGYKLMVCMDTFIHHDHDFRHGEDKDQAQFQASIEAGRKNFMDKYHGLDSWSDMSNYEAYIDIGAVQRKRGDAPEILGVDVMCGTPILQIKNELRRKGILEAGTWAFTTQAKHYCDLQTVCGHVACDRIERLADFLENRQFDYIVLGNAINTYGDIPRLLRFLLGALRPAGTLFLKLRNSLDVAAYLTMMGRSFQLDEFVTVISMEQFNQILELLEVKTCNITRIPHQMDGQSQKTLRAALEAGGLTQDAQAAMDRLLTSEYGYRITK